MNILPSNQTQSNEALARFIADTSKENWKEIDTNFLSCSTNILPALALEYAVDITGLNEAQSRELILNAYIIHKHKGTRLGLENALKPLYQNIEITEWFEDDRLARGCFNISLSFRDIAYQSKLVYKTLELIKQSKNARSHLNNIDIKVEPTNANVVAFVGFIGSPDISNITITHAPISVFSGVCAKIDIEVIDIQSEAKINLMGGSVSEMIYKDNLLSNTQINVLGGSSCQS